MHQTEKGFVFLNMPTPTPTVPWCFDLFLSCFVFQKYEGMAEATKPKNK
jgi:hypothetical protein